jgi:DNA-binding transcriptional MocR family regulator
MLARRRIPLIEDDIYGELYFGKIRPKSCKSFDKEGLVLYCCSFSKSLAQGHRIGWTIPGQFKDAVIPIKRMHSVSTNTLSQAAISHFLEKGRYELHLRHLRKALHTNSLRYIQSITEYLPEDTRFTRPQGGFALWLELSKKIDTYKLHKRALKQNVGIAPGRIFSLRSNYSHCFRIGYGEPWDERIETGFRKLGKIIREM